MIVLSEGVAEIYELLWANTVFNVKKIVTTGFLLKIARDKKRVENKFK